MSLTASTASAMRGVIDQSLAGSSAGAPLAGGAPPLNFCSIWPEAKPILQALVGIAALIPGAGAAAGTILSSLITVGDSVFSQTCSKGGGGSTGNAQAEVRSLMEGGFAAANSSSGGAAPGTNFCTIWPEAKPILQLISGIVSFIPGVGAGAGPILMALIAVGDSVFQQTCHAG